MTILHATDAGGEWAARPPSSPPGDGRPYQNPHRLAEEFVAGQYPGGTLARWLGRYYAWRGGYFRPLGDEELRQALTRFITGRFSTAHAEEIALWDGKGKLPTLLPVTKAVIGNVEAHVQALAGEPFAAVGGAPAWVNGATGPDPCDLLATPSALIDLASLAAGDSEAIRPATPDYFSLAACPHEYSPDAPTPVRWLSFLDEVFDGDSDSVAALRQFMGYLLTPDNRRQKMLFLIGASAGGKGTVLHVMRALVGEASACALKLGQFGESHGTEAMPGKLLCVVNDVRLGKRDDKDAILSGLLSHVGDELQSYNPKHRPHFDAAPTARVVVSANIMPDLPDPEGAMERRALVLRFPKSFKGREDTALRDTLLAEMPGIMAWAVSGALDLRLRGHFTQPASGLADVQRLTDGDNPVAPFVRACCEVLPGASVPSPDLFEAYSGWANENGTDAGSNTAFGKALAKAVPSLVRKRPGSGDSRPYVYYGVRLKSQERPDTSQDFTTACEGGENDEVEGTVGTSWDVPRRGPVAGSPGGEELAEEYSTSSGEFREESTPFGWADSPYRYRNNPRRGTALDTEWGRP